MTRVALVLPFYSPSAATLEEMLANFALPRRLPPELAARGHQVTLLALAARDAEFRRAGARYLAVRSHRPAIWLGRGLQRLKPSLGPAYWEPALRLARRLRGLHPEVVHIFGLTLDINLALLVRAARQVDAAVVVHFHGGVPSAGKRIRRLQRHTLAGVDRVLFTHPEQARPWIEAGLIPGWERIEQVIETSVELQPVPRDIARERTGMRGDPVCLMVANLQPRKDPLTTVRGFARIATAQPEARLYMHYLTNELEGELRALLADLPEIATRVEFRGRATPEEMPAIYSSADVLLQASLREWSGLSVLEAMACGCIPVVTDIPPFQTLTAGGRYGRLFPAGDAQALAATMLSLDPATRGALAAEVSAHFARELSFPAMARRMEQVYTDVT